MKKQVSGVRLPIFMSSNRGIENRSPLVGSQVSGKKSRHFVFPWNLEPGTYNLSRGFTLVEMIVAVALFSVVMLVSVSTLLALVNANRKAQALQSVINNLSIVLDGLVRSARMGSVYHCGEGSYTSPSDCASGGTIFAFKPYDRTQSEPPWIYVYDPAKHTILKSVTGSTSDATPITSPEITIDDMRFYVIGTTPGPEDAVQPKAVIIIKGSAGAPGTSARTTFHIQATAVQRSLDI